MVESRFRIGVFANVLGLVVALVLLVLLFGFLVDGFLSRPNIELIARQSTIVALAALGMTLVIISGGIDLSVGSTVAFVTVVIAAISRGGGTPWIALAGGLVAGATAGLVNGTLISKLKVGPFIVTLGTLLVIRGAAKGLAGEQKIDAPLNWLSSLLEVLGPKDRWMIVPIGVWLMIALAVLVSWVLKSTVFGRHVVAIGSNEQAARLCGVPVGRTKLLVYIIMGFFAGLAGLMQFSKLTVGDPTVSQGLELDVIAAVVIGGASLSGGQGSVLGSFLGAVIMTTIRAGGTQMGLANWVQEIATGAIIILAVAIDRLRVKQGA